MVILKSKKNFTLSMSRRKKELRRTKTKYTGCPKKICRGYIWYVNDNLIYTHLHRLPYVGFVLFFLMVLNLRGVNDVSVHKLNYH